ncbi:epsin-3-like isoform X1 [Seriola dumerili]|uniref:epsin-3-like isoform X1 n=1 Tax=Seriola dumerili TaxID=41447 RepID=UPI000BBF0A70|nr:epsin-3-like isoform X1 [Seriola dumerili]XP_022608149.1 epsin-3-like isoform X1 [Seriola dumerili]
MQTSSLRRQMKNMVNNYTEAEIKVREATSNDHWGPPSSLMSEIADLTFNVVAFAEVMGMIWKRLNDHGKNWRHVYKALTLLDYLIKTGSERVAQECRENIHTIQTLRDFQYIDRDGRDQGINVREKAKQLVALLRDEEKLKRERSQALKTKTRMAGVTSSLSSGSLPPPYPGQRTSSAGVYGEDMRRCRSSPSSHSSSSSPRLAPDMEQARPATSGEEELQLQLALAMSREESEKPPPPVDIDEQTQLQIAMSLSKEEAQKPVQRAPATLDMDEETQLQLALSLSKEEHQQEQLSRQGDESMLQKALEESKRQMESKGGTAFMDLVDVFAVSSDLPSGDSRWNNAAQQAAAQLGGTDPWDSLEGSTNTSRGDASWMVPPPSNSPPPPWEPPAEPWDGQPNNVSNLNATGRVWAFPANTASSRVDPFSAPLSERTTADGAVREPFPRTGSPSDGDLFDEAMDGGQMNVNGRGEGSPELFDLSHLGESLAAPSPRTCRTPESFLGPTAASLVNLDSLIPVNPPAKTKNPFLSGLSAPSATNPFQTDQPKLTLNQMGSGSTSLAPHSTTLPYSASLPLPMSHQPASLPSSLTHPTQPGLDLPGNLPEPLLPFSSASTQGSQAAQSSQNPFL